jgi:hypothetical protein
MAREDSRVKRTAVQQKGDNVPWVRRRREEIEKEWVASRRTIPCRRCLSTNSLSDADGLMTD